MNRTFPALRGIAILLVVINHSITMGLQFAKNQGVAIPQWQKYLLIPIKELGIFAVPLFLFLAGSYFVYAAQGKNLNAMYRLVPKNLFFISLPYVLWSVVFYVVVYFLFGEFNTVYGYTKSLIVGYPNNFIPLLFFFTVLAPVLIFVARKSSWLVFLAFFLYQAFLVVLLRSDIFGQILPDWAGIFAPPIIRLPIALWGVFYPLGIIYGMKSNQFKNALNNNTSTLLIILITLALFSLAVTTQLSITSLPLIEVVVPLFGLLFLTVVKREKIPFVRFFERLGKRSYGIYLTNLIIINLLFFSVTQIGSNQILLFQPVLTPLIAAITILLPLLVMEWIEKSKGRATYRLVFG